MSSFQLTAFLPQWCRGGQCEAWGPEDGPEEVQEGGLGSPHVGPCESACTEGGTGEWGHGVPGGGARFVMIFYGVKLANVTVNPPHIAPPHPSRPTSPLLTPRVPGGAAGVRLAPSEELRRRLPRAALRQAAVLGRQGEAQVKAVLHTRC